SWDRGYDRSSSALNSVARRPRTLRAVAGPGPPCRAEGVSAVLGEGGEADRPLLLRADGGVADDARGDDRHVALGVRQGQGGPGGHGRGDQLHGLRRLERGVDDDLPGDVLNTDLDFHGSSWSGLRDASRPV